MKRRGLPQYCSEFQDRHGKWRTRARRKGFKTYYFKANPGSADFENEYRAWRDGSPLPVIGKSRIRPGSVSDVIERLYRSTLWAGLAPLTKSSRRNILERFREEYGDKLISSIQREHIKSIIEKKSKTPEAGKNLLKMIRLLVRVAIDCGLRKDDPAIGIKGVRSKSQGFHTWTEGEIKAFEDKHPIGSRARLALALLLYTGQRRGDIVTFGRQHIRGGRIHLRQRKTGTVLAVAIHPDLQTALSGAVNNMTFLVTAQGKPFTSAGFGNWFRDRCDEAGLLAHCSAHGLRKAAARRLAEAGCTVKEIASVTGHRSLSEIARYTEQAEQQRMADRAIGSLDQVVNKSG